MVCWNPPDYFLKRLNACCRKLRAIHWVCLIINLSHLLILTVLFQVFNDHNGSNLELFFHWYMARSSNRRMMSLFYPPFPPQHDRKTDRTVSWYTDIQSGNGFHSKWTSRFPYILLIQFFHGFPNGACMWQEFCPKGVQTPYHISSTCSAPTGPYTVSSGKECSGLTQCYQSPCEEPCASIGCREDPAQHTSGAH